MTGLGHIPYWLRVVFAQVLVAGDATAGLDRVEGHANSGVDTLRLRGVLPDKNAAGTQPHNRAGSDTRARRTLHHKPSVYLPVRSADDGQRGLHVLEGPAGRRRDDRFAH